MSRSDEVLNRRPTPGATEEKKGPSPLGVPDDYRAPGRFGVRRGGGLGGRAPTSFGLQVNPLYMEGDEWAPAGFGPATIAELQRQLADAGILDGKFRIGVWDPSSRSAYKTLLETANGAGVDAPTALANWQAGSEFDPDPEAGPARKGALTIRQSNPDDLRAVFRKSARSVLGMKIDDERLDRMVAAYQAAEAAPQRQAYEMEGEFASPEDDLGGTITEAPSAATFGEIEAREVDPLKADARKVVDQFANMVAMLGPGGILPADGGLTGGG